MIRWNTAFGVGLMICLAMPIKAQNLPPPDPAFARLNTLVVQDPLAALAEINATLAALPKGSDPRLIRDLNRMAADILMSQGRHAEAGKLLAQLGQFAARNRDLLQDDPVSIWRLAVDQLSLANDYAAALQVQADLVQDLRDAGLTGSMVADALRRMSDLALRGGDAQQAQQLADAADTELQPFVPGRATRGAGEGFSRVEVFYATDRARTGDDYPAEFYGSGRGRLDYGTLEVTIPDTHVPGAIEEPSIWRLEFGPSPTKHLTLRLVDPLDKQAFFAKMQDRMANRDRKEAFVFIHGFNVTFDAAAKRAAQLAHDMNYTGVSVLYSWPSRGSTVGYLADAAVVQLSARRLSLFLDDLVAQSGATTINIVAHSMGNRALTEALELMALRDDQKPGMVPKFDQVIFAAPDLDAGLFTEMLPTIRPLARRMTLYASENDWALVTSRSLHGDAPRAGQGGADTLALPMLDSVDMSELGEDMLAHSYFATDASALVDLVSLFWQNLPPERRCGLTPLKEAEAGLTIWRYVRDICPDAEVLAVISSLRQEGQSSPADARRIVTELVPDSATAREVEPYVLRMLVP